MTIHVNIGEAKTRLSELVAAAIRGEEVVLNKAGEPQVRLVPVLPIQKEDAAAISARRQSAFGMWAHLIGDREIIVRDLKPSDNEREANLRRKFGSAD